MPPAPTPTDSAPGCTARPRRCCSSARWSGSDPRKDPTPAGVALSMTTAPVPDRKVDVVVIGAGQAGLSTAWALRRQGCEPGTGFVVLDADEAPGGAWQHRWPSLTLGGTHRVHDLPGLPFSPGTDDPRAAQAVPTYFAEYERTFDLPVLRPVRVHAVRRADDDRFFVET